MKVTIDLSSIDEISVNGTILGPLKVGEAQRIIKGGVTPNYAQLKGWVVTGPGPCLCTFMARKDGEEVDRVVLDFQSMYDSANFGNANPTIYATVAELLVKRYPALSRAQDHTLLPPTIEALRAFTGLERFYLCSSGTRAVETAIDLAFRYWCRTRRKTLSGTDSRWSDVRVVSAKGSLHGRSRTARALSSEESTRTNFGPLMDVVEHVPYGDIAAIEATFRTFGSGVAAVILEPVQGMTGCVVPPAGYLQRVARLCREFDTLFILDEIRTGFGRTGTDWAYERFGVVPDLLCFGKSAGGGVVPVAGVGGRDDVMSGVEPGGMLFDTWSATPIQCLAIMASVKYLSDHNLAQESERKGRVFFDELQARYPKDIVAMRGLGLFRSIETRYPAEQLRAALLEEGIWTMGLKAIPTAVFLSPPLVITDDQLAQTVVTIGRAFERISK